MKPVPIELHAPAFPATNFSELLLTPVRQGMDARTEARHHVENLLTGLVFAVSDRDRSLFTELTCGVQLRIESDDSLAKPAVPEQVWAWLGDPTGRSAITQTISTIAVHQQGNSAHYVATFQNWDAGAELSCTAIGTYAGRIVAGPQVWKWAGLNTKCPSLASSSDRCNTPEIRELQYQWENH